jgi:DNA polymerase I-like protein with 3'-5' exonuclease and polymerase domains
MRVIVHDELVFSVPERHAEEIGRELQGAMSFDLEEVTDGRLSCPITAGVSKPGKNWAQVYEK